MLCFVLYVYFASHRVYRCIWIEIIANKQRMADIRAIIQQLLTCASGGKYPTFLVQQSATRPYATGDTSNYSCVYIHAPIFFRVWTTRQVPAECNS